MATSNPTSPHSNYRPDIDGLRAIAVLAVVAFHAFPDSVHGGFIGVDIFFVISGYLISKIIFEKLANRSFRFSEFYVRRIRRIFPALLLVLGVCLAIGWLELLTSEYKQLAKHVAAGASFVANLVQWHEAGYFDTLSDTKPLLHLWSLGIEEQFYIIWPLLVWLCWKCNLNLLKVTLLLATISFSLNLIGVSKDSVATFYSPQTRFWELLCGSTLAWVTLYRKEFFISIKSQIDIFFNSYQCLKFKKKNGSEHVINDMLSVIGLALIAYSFLKIDQTLLFPGVWALIPVLGTVFVIAAGRNAFINQKILSGKIAVWLGLISFPLYLWHWPLLSFARILEGESPSKLSRILIVAMSIALAWLTYKLLEYPLRSRAITIKSTFILIFLMVITALFSLMVYKKNGLPSRPMQSKYSTYANSISIPDRQKDCFEIDHAYERKEGWFCHLGDKSRPAKYFAYGDSHAGMLIPALEKFASENEVDILLTGTSGCPPLLGIQSMRGKPSIDRYNCKKLNQRIFNYVKDNQIPNVILAARWTYYTGGISKPAEINYLSLDESREIGKEYSRNSFKIALEKTLAEYKNIGVNVFIVQDTPQQRSDPKDILRLSRPSDEDINSHSVSTIEHRENQSSVNKELELRAKNLINLDNLLCDAQSCPLVQNGKFLYSDDDHLSIEGALRIYPALSKGLKTQPTQKK